MYALIVSVALLGQQNPTVRDRINELDRMRTEQAIQAQRDAAARIIANNNQEEERKNTYIIAGAVVVGLVLLGMIARGGKK